MRLSLQRDRHIATPFSASSVVISGPISHHSSALFLWPAYEQFRGEFSLSEQVMVQMTKIDYLSL